MYEIKNGVLYRDGKAQLCLGLSYYPSYHPKKFPVRPEDDRVGELKKDIHDMAEAGFNLVRFAALGDLKRVGPGEEGVEVSFPLIDECMKAAEANDIAAQVRLQGYTLNVSGYTDDAMITPEGRELDLYECFLRASLNHEGILVDNEDCTAASARHFMASPALVSYQIYNEPAYHSGVDYNPHSIAAWRKWLVEKGLKTAEEAAALEPPRRRPILTMDPRGGESEDYRDWMNWRLFHYERLSWYLGHMNQVARRVNPHAENMTCLITFLPLNASAVMSGEDFFRTAEGMEILGVTHYTPNFGESLFSATEQLDATESAAALFGKHAWLVEYNARTNMPGNEWDRETYAAVGAGFKGIMYYQWRADYPFPDGPEPDQFGILFNDRSKTAAYHHAVKMNRLINEKLSEKIALAEKLRAGVAVLYSERANAYADSVEGSARTLADGMLAAYRALRKAGVPVDFVRACDLAENRLGVRLLAVPAGKGYYSEEELACIRSFVQKGGRAVCYCSEGGFRTFNTENVELSLQELPDGKGGYVYGLHECTKGPSGNYQMHGHLQAVDCADDVLEDAGIKPVFNVDDAPHLDVRVLKGKGYHLACLINYDTKERPVPAGQVLSLNCGAQNAQKITFFTPDRERKLLFRISGDCLKVVLPEIHNGGFLLIED